MLGAFAPRIGLVRQPPYRETQPGNPGGSKEFLVRASYLEIYNEDIRDLLSKSPEAKLELKESPDRCAAQRGECHEQVAC